MATMNQGRLPSQFLNCELLKMSNLSQPNLNLPQIKLHLIFFAPFFSEPAFLFQGKCPMYACLEFLQHRKPSCCPQVPDLTLGLLAEYSLENKNFQVRPVNYMPWIRWRPFVYHRFDVFLYSFNRNKRHAILCGASKFVSSQYWAEICSVCFLCFGQICHILHAQW